MLDADVVPLFYLSSVTGLLMVIGSLWLIYKQKIYIDTESKQVTSIETPFGKFQTNLPAILIFVIGFFFLGYPILKVSELTQDSGRTMGITGSVDSDEQPVVVCAVVAQQAMYRDKEFHLTVPVPRSGFPEYDVLVQAGTMLDKKSVILDMTHNVGSTATFHFKAPPKNGEGETAGDFAADTTAVPAEFAGVK